MSWDRAQENGSSPLARGLLPLELGQGPGERIIPARAGFTSPIASRALTARDHPRSRGVYAATPRMAARIVGSSPLARGLRRPLNNNVEPIWIIPARAGFTILHDHEFGAVGDHPRSRGVYVTDRRAHFLKKGSSPLARGLPHTSRNDAVNVRIIPARAGFTSLG